MKFVRALNRVLMTVLPVYILCHLVWTLALLVNNVENRNIYLIGDALIAFFALIAVFKIFLYSYPSPLEYYSSPQHSSSVPGVQLEKYPRIKSFLVVIIVVGSMFLLYSVRSHYTGALYDGTVIQQVTDTRIVSPMFSDEWVIAGYVSDTARRHSLPTFNIFNNAAPAIYNLLAPLISVLAGFMISTGLDIFSHYWLYVLIFQIFFIYIFFIFLRVCKISLISSAIGVLLLILLPQSNLMPGIWVMLPAYIGLPFIFLAIMTYGEYLKYFHYRYKIYLWLNLFVAGIFYPPYFLLAVVYMILVSVIQLRLKFIPAVLSFVGGGFLTYIALYATDIEIRWNNIGDVFKILWNPVVHDRFGISTTAVWNYIPILFFFTTAGGIYAWFKSSRRENHLKIFIGIVIMILVSLLATTYYGNLEIILSHQRVVFLSWMLMIILTVCFLDFIGDKLRSTLLRDRPLYVYQYGVLILLILAQVLMITTFPYTQVVSWTGVTAEGGIGQESIVARPVATLTVLPKMRNQLSTLMKGTSTKILAAPYTSLAIGSMTDLDPVSTVDGYLGVAGYKYEDFMTLPSCVEKHQKVVDLGVGYIVVHETERSIIENCLEFTLIKQVSDRYFIYGLAIDKSKK